jgi:hypothetical protein
MRYKHWQLIFLLVVLIVLAGPLMTTWPAGRVYAASASLDLRLDAPGSIRWDIANIQPGDSAIESVNLHNDGNITGYILIWISDLIDDEGTNPESETGDTANPGELSSYIYLDIANDGMTFGRLTGYAYVNTALPISLDTFPASNNQALCIANTPLYAGQSLELRWQWALSPRAGNDVQGDTVSFTINYQLTRNPPLPPYYPWPGYIFGPSDNGDTMPPATEPLLAAREYTTADGRCVIYIPEGVKVMTASGEELLYISIETPDEAPSLPQSLLPASPVYRVFCYTADNIYQGTGLEPGVQVIIHFEPSTVPERAEISIYSYRPDSDWVKLDSTLGISGEYIVARADYLNMLTLLIQTEANHTSSTESAAPVVPDTDHGSGVQGMLARFGIGVALIGVVAVTITAYIRLRRGIGHDVQSD